MTSNTKIALKVDVLLKSLLVNEKVEAPEIRLKVCKILTSLHLAKLEVISSRDANGVLTDHHIYFATGDLLNLMEEHDFIAWPTNPDSCL